jgi:hypothetical protein
VQHLLLVLVVLELIQVFNMIIKGELRASCDVHNPAKSDTPKFGNRSLGPQPGRDFSWARSANSARKARSFSRGSSLMVFWSKAISAMKRLGRPAM